MAIIRRGGRRQHALGCGDDDLQKRRKKTTGTWMQRRQSSKEWRKDSGYLGGGEWAMGRQPFREKGRIGTGTSIIKTGHNGVRNNNRQERAHSARDQKISDSFEYNHYDRI